MKFIIACFAFLLLSNYMVGQIIDASYLSKHKYDVYKHDPTSYINDNERSNFSIIPLNESTNISLTHAIFGYLPYWEYPDAMNYIQYDLLSHIAVFDFIINEDGSIDYPPNWPWVDLINTSHENGVKIILTATNFTGSQIHTILNNNNVKLDLFANLLSIMQQYSLDGVNIDFESINYSDRGTILNDFMFDLTSFVHDANQSYEVSFASPPVNWGGWNFEGLAALCDYLFIMGYNFYGPWSNTSGPCAPLTGGNFNITNVIANEYTNIVQNDPQKLILGVPYYGNIWTTQNTQPYSNIINHISQPTYEIAMNNAIQDTLLWDEISLTSWSYYETTNSVYQTWFDTDTSLCLKYSLAEDYQLKGVGMWALGYDGIRLELWDELREHFLTPIHVENNPHKQDWDFRIFPIPTTGVLTVSLPNGNELQSSISIVDLHGKVIYYNTNTRNHSSSTIRIDLQGHNPGMYIAVLNIWSHKVHRIVSKRIILQ